MSSFALKGLLTGAATALSAKMESEKEKTNKLLATRVSLAYENSRKYNDTVEALRQDSIERDNILMSYNDPDNPFTEPERIVAMQMPTLIQTWSNLRERGHNVSLKEMIRVGPNAINMTVDGYLKQLGAMREQDQTGPSVITPSTSFVSPSEERQRKMLSELSSQVNMTPEDVQRFQTMPRMATRESYGGFTKEVMDKLIRKKNPQEQLTDLASQYIEVSKREGPDSPRAQALREEGNLIKNSIDIFGAGATTQLGHVNKLTLALTELETKGGDPDKIKAIKRELDIASDNYLKYINPPTEKKDPAETLSKLDSWYTKTVRNNYLNKFGNRPLTNSDWTYNPVTGIPVYSGRHSETGQYAKIEEMNIRIRALNMIVAPLLKDGRATNEAVNRFLQSNNLFTKDEQGRWILPQEITIPQRILDAVKAEEQRKLGGSIPSNQRASATPPDPSRIAGTMTNPNTQAASEATPTRNIINKEQFETYRTRNNLTRDQAIEALKKEGFILAGEQ